MILMILPKAYKKSFSITPIICDHIALVSGELLKNIFDSKDKVRPWLDVIIKS